MFIVCTMYTHKHNIIYVYDGVYIYSNIALLKYSIIVACHS